MLVRDILKNKGSDIITISVDDRLVEAVALLAKRRIGALPVLSSSGTIKGILSERDIVRALANNPQSLSDRVASHMTENVITCSPDFSVSDVMSIMTKGRFRHLPIVDGQELIGIISIGDVVKAHIDEIVEDNKHMMSYIASA
jgi:CBS domain-containing protein